MREKTKDINRLRHIAECIGNIKQFLQGKTFDEMKLDVMCYHAVVYNIMIIGEAANMLTSDFRDSHADVPWRNIIDMRNVLVHGYYTVSPIFIWETYTKDLGFLETKVAAYIKEIDNEK